MILFLMRFLPFFFCWVSLLLFVQNNYSGHLLQTLNTNQRVQTLSDVRKLWKEHFYSLFMLTCSRHSPLMKLSHSHSHWHTNTDGRNESAKNVVWNEILASHWFVDGEPVQTLLYLYERCTIIMMMMMIIIIRS